MAKKIPVTIRRFNEGTGERFMQDGTSVRCQCRSKSRLKKYCPPDTELNAYLRALDKDAYWPEAQCGWPAQPNTFMCKKHGGGSSHALKTSKDLLDYLPGYMAEKIKMFMGRPDLLDRSFEIRQLQARNIELYERQKTGAALGGESRIALWRALKLMEKGNVQDGIKRATDVLKALDEEEASFNEIRTNMVLMKDMTRTHVATAKDLQQIITIDVFIGTLVAIADIIAKAVEKYIHDRRTGELLVAEVQSGITGLLNARLAGVPVSLAEQNNGEPGVTL